MFKQFGEALPRPGMNIQEVPNAELDARIAKKRADAAELVNKQIGNQKTGANTAEPGFVPPQTVVPPKVEKQNFQQQKNAMKQSLSFFNDQLDNQYANFKNLYNKYSSGKGRESFESMDPQSIKNYLAGKVSPTEIDNILYSQDMKPDEVLDKLSDEIDVYEKKRWRQAGNSSHKRNSGEYCSTGIFL